MVGPIDTEYIAELFHSSLLFDLILDLILDGLLGLNLVLISFHVLIKFGAFTLDLVGKLIECTELFLDVSEAFALLINSIVLLSIKLLVEKHCGIGHVLEAAVHDSGPVVSHELHRVVVEEDPFFLWLLLFFIDLAGLRLDVAVVDARKEAHFYEDAAEEGKVVVVPKADHPSQHVLLLWSIVIVAVKLRDFEQLWNCDKRLQHVVRLRIPVQPLQVKG